MSGADDLLATVRRLEGRIAQLEGEVRLLSRRNDRETLREIVARRARRGLSAPVIDILCGKEIDAKSLTKADLFLDPDTITRYFAKPGSRIANIPPNRLFHFMIGIAQRLANRLARRYSERLSLPFGLLRGAWFYAIYMEVWQLVPARHLARRLAARNDGDPIVIPLDKTILHYLSYGADTNGIELLYLAGELQRRGAPVTFVCTDAAVSETAWREGSMRLQLAPFSDLWIQPPLPPVPANPSGSPRAVLVGAGIRGIARLLTEVPDPLRVQSPYVMDPAFGTAQESVMDPDHLPVLINLPLKSVADEGLPSSVALLSVTLPHADLGEYLLTLIGGATQAAFRRARSLVDRHRLAEAHICDHAFFESAMIAHAVKEKGGRVVLWPHAFNLSLPALSRLGEADEVRVALKPGAELWRKHRPDVTVKIIPNLWLPPCLPPREPTAGEPVSIVVVCSEVASWGRHFQADQRSIEDTFRALFRVFERLKPDIVPYYRARSQHNLQWLWELARRPSDFPYVVDGPATIVRPNMVFLFVGQLSSALFEGIVRGIPSLYLREGDSFPDYLDGDLPDCLPTGDRDFIAEEFIRCRDPSYRRALIDRQRDWYQAMMDE